MFFCLRQACLILAPELKRKAIDAKNSIMSNFGDYKVIIDVAQTRIDILQSSKS